MVAEWSWRGCDNITCVGLGMSAVVGAGSGEIIAESEIYRLPAYGRLAECGKMENTPLGRYNV